MSHSTEKKSNDTNAGANRKLNILLLMSGSIACAKISSLVSAWAKQGHEVEIACTRSVAQFIGHATLEGFSGNPVMGDAFESGRVMDHIHLARRADLIIAAPATSNLINKLAAGIADDAVSSLWQAAFGQGKPMFIVPAMNTNMWNYPATSESVAKLKSWDINVLPTADGDLACGELGEGRMLEPQEILRYINDGLNATRTNHAKRILITAGGTREPIDSVRFIGNTSTGRTAAVLSDALRSRGHQVHWLGAESALRPGSDVSSSTFSSFDDLSAALKKLLSERDFDAVIHAAAVSDFSVERIENRDGSTQTFDGKLSSGDGISLHLKPNPKLLDQLRGWSRNPDVWIIGFKLTHGAREEQREGAITRLFSSSGADAVVHNDLLEMQDGLHPFTLHRVSMNPVSCEDTGELAFQIHNLLEKVS